MRIFIAIMLLTGIGVSYKRAIEKPIFSKIAKRKTIGSVKDKNGIVKNVGTMQQPIYIIRCKDEYLNLFTANIPSVFQQDNLAVTFSGDLKEMQPIEDDLGQYFVVNKIVKQ